MKAMGTNDAAVVAGGVSEIERLRNELADERERRGFDQEAIGRLKQDSIDLKLALDDAKSRCRQFEGRKDLTVAEMERDARIANLRRANRKLEIIGQIVDAMKGGNAALPGGDRGAEVAGAGKGDHGGTRGMSKHTPGPWKVCGSPYGNNRFVTATVEGHLVERVAHVFAEGNKDVDANARLVAAAPELLAACKMAYDMVKNCPGNWQEQVEQQLAVTIAKADSPGPMQKCEFCGVSKPFGHSAAMHRAMCKLNPSRKGRWAREKGE